MKLFGRRRPDAVLAMGGFTSLPPVLAGKHSGAATFLHESNSIPGRANRWLAPLVDEAFVGFPMAARRLQNQSVQVTGTPVRPQFEVSDPAPCRLALGLDPQRPVVLVMGGSQGASGINELIKRAVPMLSSRVPELQYLHLTGPAHVEEIRTSYRAEKSRAVVLPFLTEMELALGAGTVAVSRAGASSLAELAAMRVPSILIPYPHAADDHQFYNARAFEVTGAAKQLNQSSATPEALTELICQLVQNSETHTAMRSALERWHVPTAAEQIASRILRRLEYSQIESAATEGGIASRFVAAEHRQHF